MAKRTDGLSLFILDMRHALRGGLTIRPIRTMMNHATTEVFFDNVRIPTESLIGEEGKGFRYVLSGMNAERILIGAECIGDAKWFIGKASAYSKAPGPASTSHSYGASGRRSTSHRPAPRRAARPRPDSTGALPHR